MERHNLACLLENSAEAHPERDAIVFGSQRMTYAQVNAAANQVANALASRGIGIGDSVALSMPNLPYFTIAYFGIVKTGAAVVPLNVLLREREIAYHLRDSEAKAYICFEGTPELPIGQAAHAAFSETDSCTTLIIATADATAPSPYTDAITLAAAMTEQPSTFQTADVAADDTAVILYTSGTTGEPKGAELRHRNMADNARAGQTLFEIDPEHPDTLLCVLPLFHAFGQTVIQNTGLASGGTIVLLPRFEPSTALDLMLSEKVSLFAGVPTMYWGLLGVVDDDEAMRSVAENLRIAIAGGSALPRDVHQEFQRRFGITILEGYGLSETSPITSFSRIGARVRVGSIGYPIPGVEMKLIDPESGRDIDDRPDAVGEIAIKGHNVMKGYYQRPEATRAAITDGWFRTGDLATRDEDGWYYIVDRVKDMIIRGGYNVYPREIEELLMTHPAVSLTAVIGVPHTTHGEEIKAYVIADKNSNPVSADELIDWCKQRLAAYKYPREIEFVDQLPMTATGKILKRELT
ncbi:long-chain-fatty-acid--CoA ligase [Tsukamurella paurometabola]|uniref:Long-chain fatty acid--CoA ligase n=1 Tax=Tsukamurella paurometabola TaxID=2061 RepID=A0ABS5NFB1_TSUPA|nr:long-chain fatty acid--CoA ligase [Tsukamurella paurometabola]MBS4102979.1 long-chain fatty acid--CoA ligase [Tsukamurella paurometabola]